MVKIADSSISSEIPTFDGIADQCRVLKFPVQIVRDVVLGKPLELLIPKKKEHLRNTKTAAKGFRIV